LTVLLKEIINFIHRDKMKLIFIFIKPRPTCFLALWACTLLAAPGSAQAPMLPSAPDSAAPPVAQTAVPVVETSPTPPPGEPAPETPAAATSPGPVLELAPATTTPTQARLEPQHGDTAQPPPPTSGGTDIGGYAELHFNLDHASGPGRSLATIDLARMVLFVGHRFNERLRFYSELEVEHAVVSSDRSGEVEVEQAFLDYLLIGKALGLRGGLVLIPMGIINQWHEPPVFHGVERPAVDTLIIPSTWREGGLGAFGEPVEGLRYELYLVGGLDPRGFSAAQGLREGRQEVAQARADGLAVAGRVEIEPLLGAVLGISGYFGRSGPNADLYDRAGRRLDLDVPVWGTSADARVRHAGLEARAVFALFSVGDTAQLRQARGADGNNLAIDAGAKLWGAYGELAYDLLHLVGGTEQQLLPFVRVERYDTMAAVRGRGRLPGDQAYAVTEALAGLTYRPLPQVAFKGDFRLRNADGPSPTSGQLDLGVGVMF
jgi:hypothetical protein